ncbi:Uroporphyrinogen decarboxylase in heme biosynthesis [Naganishia albida]|nr:Uroporphyrinogen decarboxylase in heme biosynthesis [Naganishia albida]
MSFEGLRVDTENFPVLQNDLILRAAKGEETERAPVWVMRQAGRYLPEFLAVRKDHSFFECCKTPEIACELTLQPIRRFKGLLDAAIIFCDILVVPEAMGLTIEMNPAPSLPNPIRTPEDLARLPDHVNVNEKLGYVFEAVNLTRHRLDGEVPLIGFCGAPWTLMAYMVEGGGSKTYQKAKEWLYRWPEASRTLLAKVADVCVDLLVGQVLAGAQMLQVFDSWASELPPVLYQEMALPPCQYIAKQVRAKLQALGHPGVPMTLFAKGANSSLDVLAAESGYDVLGLDSSITGRQARQLVGHKVALQGNADPMLLYGGQEAIQAEVKKMCEGFLEGGGGWIANLGHGVTPQVQVDDFRCFLDSVHKYSRRNTEKVGGQVLSEKL